MCKHVMFNDDNDNSLVKKKAASSRNRIGRRVMMSTIDDGQSDQQ